MNKKWRGRCSGVLCLIVLSPMMPFALVQWGAQSVADFMDWLWDGRWLARKLGAWCDAIEWAFGVDAETDYAAWQARMKDRRRIVTLKCGAQTEEERKR